MCFIHIQPINAELFECDNIILLFFRFQFLQSDFQLTLGPFQLERQQETMKLYQRAGVSPMSGCLPMLFQFPVLMAMLDRKSVV